MSLALYQVTDQYMHALETLPENENFDDQTVKDTLDGLRGSIETKALNVGAYCKNLELKADTLREYEKRMAEKRRTIEKQVAYFKKYIQKTMEIAKFPKIEGLEFSLSLRNTPKSVIIEDEKYIPSEFISKTTVQYDKKKLKEALEKGTCIQGVELQSRQTLVIK